MGMMVMLQRTSTLSAPNDFSSLFEKPVTCTDAVDLEDVLGLNSSHGHAINSSLTAMWLPFNGACVSCSQRLHDAQRHGMAARVAEHHLLAFDQRLPVQLRLSERSRPMAHSRHQLVLHLTEIPEDNREGQGPGEGV